MQLPWLWRKLRPAAAQAELAALAKPGFVEEAVPSMEAVYRFALRLTRGDEAEAEDVVQETFIRAYRAWERYTPGTSCRSWLFTICRNEFLRMRQRETRHTHVNEAEIDLESEALAAAAIYGQAAAADPERVFFESLVDAEITGAIDALPEEYRETIVLSDLQGLTTPEIAAVLGVPVGTVKSRVYRARRLLQQHLYKYALEMGYLGR
ncbi:MAG: sigma-70 family RNA polymerase sigma factor [Gemmatimonadota bacterium]